MPDKYKLSADQIRRLQKLADILDQGDIALLGHLFEFEEEVDERLLEAKNGLRGENGKDGADGAPGERGEPGAPGRDGKDGLDGAPGKDGKDGRNGIDGRDGKDGTPGHIKDLAPQEVRDLLELLPEGEKLSIDAIENLREELSKKSKVVVSGGGITGRDIVKPYDLSPYLDGVTKTFNIPGTWYVISVATSSVPHALRPTIDYTWTPQTITFTSEINADTTLAAGQTVILTLVVA